MYGAYPHGSMKYEEAGTWQWPQWEMGQRLLRRLVFAKYCTYPLGSSAGQCQAHAGAMYSRTVRYHVIPR